MRAYPGEKKTYNVEIRKTAGKPKAVSLTLGGAGIFDFVEHMSGDYSFAGRKDFEAAPNPSIMTTLTLSTTEKSVPGEYKLAVRGVGGKYRKSGDFELFIDAPVKAASPDWEIIASKLKRPGAALSKDELLMYLGKLEQANPGADWKKLIAQLDTGKGGLDLFGLNVPSYVIDPVGETISIQSSATALHSEIEKPGLLSGLANSWNSFWKASQEQKQGESLGRWIADYFKTSGNENKKLSDAYNEYFNAYGLQRMKPNPNPYEKDRFIPK